MPYCQHCGGETDQVIVIETPATEAFNAEVEIARINRQADVDIAKIQAGQDRNWNETRETVAVIETEAAVEETAIEAESGVEAAEAVADALTDVLAPEEPDPVTVVSNSDASAEMPSEEPPPEFDETSEPKSKANVWW
jgi:hypothetical protein